MASAADRLLLAAARRRAAARREAELSRQLLADRREHGFSVVSAAGERVDPRQVRMLGLPEAKR